MDAFDILAVCAHPDDAELVMGGTIAREAARGRRVAMWKRPREPSSRSRRRSAAIMAWPRAEVSAITIPSGSRILLHPTRTSGPSRPTPLAKTVYTPLS